MRGYTSLILPELQEIIATGDAELARAAVEDLLPADIADIVDNLAPAEAARLLSLLPLADATEALGLLDADRQRAAIETVGRPRLVSMLDEMSADDRADLIKRLPPATVELLMPLLAQAARNELKRLVSYPEQTAGALMTTEYVWLKADLTADEALKKLRQVAPDSETIYYVYMVDADRRLTGVASLREVICAPPGKRLAELMTEHPVMVRTDVDQEEVARLFEKYDLSALPVIDADSRLVGIITVDDIVDVIEDEATEDVQKLGAVAPLEHGYLQTPIAALVRKRVVWLAVLLLAQNATALAISGFETVVPASVLLLILPFIPLVTSSGGNAGSQSATLITRALATGDVAVADGLRVLGREVVTGFLLGLPLAAVGLASALVFGKAGSVMLLVAVAISCAVTIGNILGALAPLGFHRVGIDPAVASSPLIASLSDVIGITTYFALARWFVAG